MLLSDPIYYFGTFLCRRKSSSFSTFEDMQGRWVGTVTGFTLVPELKEVEGSARSSCTTRPTARCAI